MNENHIFYFLEIRKSAKLNNSTADHHFRHKSLLVHYRTKTFANVQQKTKWKDKKDKEEIRDKTKHFPAHDIAQ